MVQARGVEGDKMCCRLDLSGVFDMQNLLSAYYMPLEIDIFLQDPLVCGQLSNATTGAAGRGCTGYTVSNPRICIDQIILTPEYVSAFEASLIQNSGGAGVQIPFNTYYTYSQDITPGDTTFWVRKPVRFLRSVMWGAVEQQARVVAGGGAVGTGGTQQGFEDAYRFARQALVRGANGAYATGAASDIHSWEVSVGSKRYRMIESLGANANARSYEESDCMFNKATKSYDNYQCNNEFKPSVRKFHLGQTGLDLDFSPDGSLLAAESTLNNNDVRLRLKGTAGSNWRVYVFMKYAASLAVYPGNEVRLLET